MAHQLDGYPLSNSSPELLDLTAPPGTPDEDLRLGYGQFLPALWKEYAGFRMTGLLQFPWEGGYITYQTRISSFFPKDTVPSTVGPVVTPPRAVRVNGHDPASDMAGVGTAPSISWTAPRAGVPTYYLVSVLQIVHSGSGLAWDLAADFVTASTSIQMPLDLLQAGNQYVAYVQAVAEPDADYAAAPYRHHIPTADAETATAPFAP
jgi:hypothetical protein